MAAQGLVAGIRQGCEFLREGKQQLGEVKKAIGEVKAFVGEAKGVCGELLSLWNLITGLFGAKSSKPTTAVPPKSAAEPKATAPSSVRAKAPSADRELSYEEFQAQAIHDICEQLKQFFEIKRQLTEHCHQLEEESKTTTDIEGAALDRIQIEMQLDAMTVQIREAMIYTPKEVGLADIYSRFLKMYNQILEEQEFARQVAKQKERDAKWRRELLKNHRIDRAVVATTVFLALLWMWAMMLSLGWLVRTQNGLSSLL